MVVISEKSIERMMEEVAPKVKRLTTWDPHLEDLKVRIIRRDQYFESVFRQTYDHLGIDMEAKTAQGKKSVIAAKMILPYIILAQYEAFSGTMYILPDNLRFGTNESGVSTLLGHELVHRCQFANNPNIKEMYASLVRRVTGTNVFDEDKAEDKNAKKYLQSFMTLIEGDASFVQDQLKKMFYQDANNKTSRISSLVALALLVSSIGNGENSFLQKMKQYSRGKKIVERLYHSNFPNNNFFIDNLTLPTGRTRVNALYQSDEKELYELFK